jgi:hypothetical protein
MGAGNACPGSQVGVIFPIRDLAVRVGGAFGAGITKLGCGGSGGGGGGGGGGAGARDVHIIRGISRDREVHISRAIIRDVEIFWKYWSGNGDGS